MTDTESTSTEPSHGPSNELPHGGPSDMVPFESPSHWERFVLVIAVAGTLVLAVLAGLGAVRRAGGDVGMSSARLTTTGSTSSSSR